MILDITQYEHPALRTPGRAIETVDDSLRTLAADMIETMAAAEGVGLAAQQVGLPLQMFVLDVPQMKNRPSTMKIAGKPVDFEALMPMVLLNPVIKTSGRQRCESEGCLSFPGLSGEVNRPWKVHLRALGLDGETIEFEAEGFLARAIQHEYDHNQGVLFIDRMSVNERRELPDEARVLCRPAPPFPV